MGKADRRSVRFDGKRRDSPEGPLILYLCFSGEFGSWSKCLYFFLIWIVIPITCLLEFVTGNVKGVRN